MSEILSAIGEDLSREGLVETPNRVARMYESMFSGVRISIEEAIDTVFEAESRDPVVCLLYTSPSPRDVEESRMPSSA